MAFQYGLDLNLNEKIDEDLVIYLTSDDAGRLLGYRGNTITDIREMYPHLKIEISDKRFKKRFVKICGQKKTSAYVNIMKVLR
jgi:predicted RNA-binding protein YlqC (UPF0109 family)